MPYELFNFLTVLCDNFKIPSCTDCLGDTEIRITVCLSIFNDITEIITKIVRLSTFCGLRELSQT